ncbi:MAG TPA: alpha/beta hydrolase-fold protein [Microbacterium sp.]|uniref:alpha/beta hydrolase-fold protein n=1 Tax=Microbacterium sp. TaxID=51671 RepID=UPI002B47117B|nr:alpha/beta hydrolase-fold protein [Microbacterium sp.]HKT56228.1 alpha/beta hydrolase-fold protein [Microbacterium sp.]
MRELLDIQIIGGALPWILTLASLALLIALLIRRPTRGWVIGSLIAVAAGVAAATAVFVWANVTGYFEIQLPNAVLGWTAATFAGIGLAVVCLWRGRWWQRTIAAGAIVAFALTGTVQVNAAFGLNPTVADLLGVTVTQPISLPSGHTVRPEHASGPLYLTWRAPAGMPAQGQTGTIDIPATASHFPARPASIYLPPAALVAHAPALPLVVFMKGFPGTTNIQLLAGVIDGIAARHHGLAPIILVADQVGPSGMDPGCVDGGRGNAETYIATDVFDWARTHLNIIQNPRYWTIAGYSNGATCALKIAAQYPKVFRTVFAESPELYLGTHYAPDMIRNVFHGSRAAWQAAKPATIMRENAHLHRHFYRGLYAIVTTGALDTVYGPQSRALARDAQHAGMFVRLTVVPGVTHVGANYVDGLAAGFALLYPRLGLAPGL